MKVYLDLLIILNFAVDLFLLLGSCRLSGAVPRFGRCCAGAAIGAIYGCMCLVPGFTFLGNWFWRGIFFLGVIITSFGLNRSAVRKGCLFLVLSFAMYGVTGLGSGSVTTAILCGAGTYLLCRIGLPRGNERIVPVELTVAGKKLKINALVDTGNMLKDPVTGAQVLVLGAQLSRQILGLEQPMLTDPVAVVENANIKGLRLVPYSTVGQKTGLLLALAMDQVRINGKNAGRLVAFSPQIIGAGEDYQALTGGIV